MSAGTNMTELPFHPSPHECPVCHTTPEQGSLFLFIQNFESSDGKFTLYECPSCHIQHWTPFKNPGPEWYERCIQNAERKELEIPGRAQPLKWNMRQFIQNPPYLQAKGKRLLDVGCGTGKFMLAAQALGFDVYGVDFDTEQIALARLHGLTNVSAQDFFSFLGTTTDRFDVVTGFEVIEHFDNPKTFLELAYRVLKPGGFLALTTPNRCGFVHKNAPSDFPFHHLTRWDKHSLGSFVKAAGFSGVSVREEIPVDYVLSKFRFGVRSQLKKIFSRKKQTAETTGGIERSLVVAGGIKDKILRPLAWCIAAVLFLCGLKGQELFLIAQK